MQGRPKRAAFLFYQHKLPSWWGWSGSTFAAMLCGVIPMDKAIFLRAS